MTLLGAMTLGASAQRVTDKLTRGIVAVPQGDKTGQDSRYGMSGTGVFVSWRILPTEYYDTKYNLYRDGSLVAAGLTVSNYQDDGGSKTSTYRVVPVVKDVEQTAAAAECKPWDHQYWEIPVLPVVGRDGNVETAYSLNDCSVADVDWPVTRPTSTCMSATRWTAPACGGLTWGPTSWPVLTSSST